LHGAYRLVGRRSSRPLRTLAVGVGVLGVLSLVSALVIGSGNLDRAYYGTDTRAYQLLLGVVLALVPSLEVRSGLRRGVNIAAALAAVGVLVLATDVIELSPIVRGAWVAAATAVVIVALESGHATTLSRVLSWRPLVTGGTLSYAIYLWHLPVLFVLADQWEIDPWPSFAIAAVVSVALSLASGRILESPVRHSSRLDSVPRVVIASALTLSLLGGILIPPILLSPSSTVTLTVPVDGAAAAASEVESQDGDPTTPTTEPSEVSISFDWEEIRQDKAVTPECRAADPSLCTVRVGSGAHVLLIGDSHARVWMSTFEPYAEALDYTLSVASFSRCSWHLDTMVAIGQDIQQECFGLQHEWVDTVIPALQPDVVVLIHRATFDPAQVFISRPEKFIEAGDATVSQILETASAVVIIEPTPLVGPDDDPLVCLADGGSFEACSFDANAEETVLEGHYRFMDESDDRVQSLDLDQLACPRLPRCDVLVDTSVVWRDNSHMTATYAASLADALTEMDPVAAALAS
jgi:hypothetical protein